MKSEQVPTDTPVERYPQLRRSSLTGIVVLFHNANQGTAVFVPADRRHAFFVGQYREDWAMDNFTVHNGAIKLSN